MCRYCTLTSIIHGNHVASVLVHILELLSEILGYCSNLKMDAPITYRLEMYFSPNEISDLIFKIHPVNVLNM